MPERATFGDVAEGTRRSMLSNRRRDTKPEMALRRILHARGRRFRVDFPIPTAARPIRADIAFPRRRVAIFVDGCFWHGCPEHGTMPTRNREYWEPKIRRNRQRDAEQTRLIEEAGWIVLRYWTHCPPEEMADGIEATLARAATERWSADAAARCARAIRPP